MNKPTIVEAFTEGMTCKAALMLAHEEGHRQMERQLMEAFGYFCQHDGAGMHYTDARQMWENLRIGVDPNTGRIAIPVGLPEEE